METLNKKIYEKLALNQETFARAQKLAARCGAGVRDFIPQIVAEKVEELKNKEDGKIISSYVFDSQLYWDICNLAGGKMPTKQYLEELVEETIAEKWKGEA